MNFRNLLVIAAVTVSASSFGISVKQGQILVKLKKGAQSSDKVYASIGGKVTKRFEQIGWEVVSVPIVAKAESMAKKARGLRGVAKAEVSTIGDWLDTPNDPFYSQQYGPQVMHVPAAWDAVPSTSNVKIMVLDSGISQTHPDLQPQIEQALDFSSSPAGAEDLNGHGSHVSGITAAATNNGIGIAGVARNCKIIMGKVGDAAPTSDALIAGLTWAADNGANIIQMSLSVGDSQALEDAINYAWGKGLVVIDAAGNSDTNQRFYPSSYENCIAVAATDAADQFADFSNYGSWVDVAAPGVDIYSTYASGSYATLSGTSMAAPHVSGVAGLLLSFKPTATATEIRDALETTAIPLGNQSGKTVVFGRVDAIRAIFQLAPAIESEPDTVNRVTGTALNLAPANLVDVDDQDVALRSESLKSLGGVTAVECYVPLTGDPAKAFSASLSVTATAAKATTQQLYLYNYTTNEYEFYRASPLKATQSTTTFTLVDLKKYVSDGKLRLMLRTVLPSRFGRSSYNYLVDQVVLSTKYSF